MTYQTRLDPLDKSVLNEVNNVPDTCPDCGKGIEPVFCYQYGVDVWKEYDGFLQIIFRCPRKDCQKLFIAYYGAERGYSNTILILRKTYLLEFVTFEKFPQSVTNISGKFVDIYNESKIAEENNLLLIAGPGYRKALEFLVKDYLIKLNPELEKSIKTELLGDTIKRITNKNIKTCASRAAWLGNDETHYLRKWENKDLQDLKNLIKMVVDWIDLTELSGAYAEEMPFPKVPENDLVK